MNDYLSKIKPAVCQASAYTLSHFQAPVKINQNENPYDLPDVIKRAIVESVEKMSWCRYPAFVPSRLIGKLAAFSGWKEEGILVGNGSNELIQALLMVTAEPGKRVVISEPTFTLYRLMSTILGAEPVSVLMTQGLQFDVPSLLEASRTADVTILCRPNNPTGSMLEETALRKILSAASGLVVVDEAYHEFSGTSAVPLLAEFSNLVVLRTFSKAMSMAGLRVGYLMTAPELAGEIGKAKLPYNLNIFSMAAAEAAVEHAHLLRPVIQELVQERERILCEMKDIAAVKPYPSHANFVAFRTPLDANVVFESLYGEGILIRDVSRYPMLDKTLRVSVGTPDENNRFLTSLRNLMRSVDQTPG
ncbi:MAG: histidinol-phosphate transaminase [Acidobacteriota bacterium]